jgi:hypothetical protein
MKRVIFILIVTSVLVNQQSAKGQGDWFTGGNFVTPGQFAGSTNNAAFDIHTDNAFRLRVNPIGTTTINLSPVNTTGYVGINTTEPRSYLHINGPNNTQFSGGGYRRWMQTGVFNLENSDNLFTGLLPMGLNRSDTVWVWGDDSQGEPTNFSRFIFTGAATIFKDSNPKELQSFTVCYVGCVYNYYFHLLDYKLGHPPQTERST